MAQKNGHAYKLLYKFTLLQQHKIMKKARVAYNSTMYDMYVLISIFSIEI